MPIGKNDSTVEGVVPKEGLLTYQTLQQSKVPFEGNLIPRTIRTTNLSDMAQPDKKRIQMQIW